MSKTLSSEFLKLKSVYDSENELVSQLEKKPLTESQVDEILKRGYSQVDGAKHLKLLQPLLEKLRAKELIVPDKPQTFDEFKTENKDSLCIKASTLQQMETPEYKALTEYLQPKSVWAELDERKYKHLAVYQNNPIEAVGQGGKAVIHYTYDKGDEYHHSGTGFMTSRERLRYPLDKDSQAKYSQATKLYREGRREVSRIFKELGLDKVPEEKRNF